MFAAFLGLVARVGLLISFCNSNWITNSSTSGVVWSILGTLFMPFTQIAVIFAMGSDPTGHLTGGGVCLVVAGIFVDLINQMWAIATMPR